MCEVIAGAVGRVAADVECLTAFGGPATLQSVHFILPEGTLCYICFDVYGLGEQKKKQSECYPSGRGSFY